MQRRARFLFAPLVLASGVGFLACSSPHETGKSSASIDRTVDAQRAMDVVQRSKAFARVVETAMAPSKTERGWILAARSTKAAVVNSHLDATLPTHAQGAIHVGNKDRAGESLEVSPEGVEPVEGYVVDNALVFANAAPSTDILQVLDGVEVEELRVLRDANAPTVARYSIRKGEGIASVRVEGNRVQALDKDGHVRIQSAGVFAVDAKGVRRDLAIAVQHDGDREVLTASLDATGLDFPVIVDPAWATVASMKNPRQYAASVQLSTGKIMVAGGENFAAATNVVEQYDPGTDTWSDMPAMTYDRSNGKLFAFPGGRALAVGGLQGLVGSSGTAAPNELFDGTAWVAPATDPDPRSNAATYELGDGRILFIGGQKQTYTACTASYPPMPSATCGGTLCVPLSGMSAGPGYCSGTLVSTTVNTAEIYNGTTNTWTAAGTLAGYPLAQGTSAGPTGTTVNFPAVTLFQKIATGPNAGKYLVVYNSTTTSTSTAPDKVIAQIFDPATNTWSAALPAVPGTGATATSIKARGHYGFTQLPSGKYLFVAGLGLSGTAAPYTTAALATSFTLDLSAATAVWTPAGVLRCARDRFATVPSSGKVHVTMGNIQPFIDPVKGSQYCNEEEYNEATDTWTVTQQSTTQSAPWTSTFGPSSVITCPDGCFLPSFPNGMSIFPYTTSGGFGGPPTTFLTLVDFGWRTFFPASMPDATKIGTNPAIAITSTGKMLAAGGKTTSGMSSDAELWTQMPDGSDCSYVTGFSEGDLPTADCYHGWCDPDYSVSGTACVSGSSTKKCSDKPGAICANDYQCNVGGGGKMPTTGCGKAAPTDATGHCTTGAVCNTASDCGGTMACVSDPSGTSSTGKRCSMFCTADAQCPSAKSHCVADYRGYTGSFCGSMPMVCSDDTHALCPATATVCPWGGFPGGSSTPQVCTSGKCYDAPTCTSASSCSTGLACHDYGAAGKRCYYQCSGDTECVSPPLVCGATSGGGGGGTGDGGVVADGGVGGTTFDFNPAAPCVTAPPVDAGSDTGSATDSGSTATDSGSGGSDGSTGSDSGSGGSDGGVATDSGSTTTDSGSTATDSGSTATDSGSTATDSGSTATDSGSADDTGSTTTDSGSADDTGSTTTDTGSADDTGATTDSGSSAEDSGGNTLDDAGAIVPAADETGGCGCEVPGTGHTGTSVSLAGIAALAGLVIARRRRKG